MAFLASSTAGPPRLLRHGEMTPFQHYCAVRRSLPGVCDLDVMKIIVLGPETSLLEKLAHGRENELPTSSIRNLLLCCRTLAKLVTEAVQNIVIEPAMLSAIPLSCRFSGDRHCKSVQHILRELPSAAVRACVRKIFLDPRPGVSGKPAESAGKPSERTTQRVWWFQGAEVTHL